MNEAVNTSIMENEHIKEFLKILQDNNKDPSSLLSMLNYVTGIESQLNKAVEELAVVRHELSTIRDEQNHPLKTALEKAARSIEATINELKKQLDAIKEKIITGCKNAVAEFKDKGIAVLNGIAKFFHIKPMFENLRNNMENGIKRNEGIINKLESAAAEYHSAGRHIRNIGRALRGKEPIQEVKPNGKLAKLIQAPFRIEIKSMKNALKDTGKAIAALERLDKSSTQIKTAAAERKNEKSSTLEEMKVLKKQIEADRETAPVSAKTKRKEAEL